MNIKNIKVNIDIVYIMQYNKNIKRNNKQTTYKEAILCLNVRKEQIKNGVKKIEHIEII